MIQDHQSDSPTSELHREDSLDQPESGASAALTDTSLGDPTEADPIETTTDAAEDFVDEEEEQYVHTRRSVFTLAITGGTVLILALLAGNVYQWTQHKNNDGVATVNGAVISQRDYNRVAGATEQTMQTLVDQKLIDQEAARQKVSVSNGEVDAEVDAIKKQLGSPQEFQTALGRAHLTEPQLREQIRTQLLAQRLGGKGVEVSDQEAQAFYDQNKAQFGQLPPDQAKTQIKAQLMDSKQRDAIQTWIAGLRQKAKISIHLPT